MSEPLTEDELRMMRYRRESASTYGHFHQIVRQDIPRLLEEIDRLKGKNKRLVRLLAFVTKENDGQDVGPRVPGP